MALTILLLTASGLTIAILVVQYATAYLQSPLKKLPGPFLARFSDIWRLWNHYSQRHIETQRQLHEKHGNIVRIGPKTVSVTDPELIKTIYSTRGTFVKVSLLHLRISASDSKILTCKSPIIIRSTTPFKVASASPTSSARVAMTFTQNRSDQSATSTSRPLRLSLSP
jgi:hypothetical protein